MTDLVTDVKSLELETLKNLRSSEAQNTLRAYKADYKDFASFCIKNGFRPMPSEPKVITLYLTNLSKTSKFSTLKRRLASISVIHKISGHYIDVKHPMITENLMGIKRILGSYQKAKKPILINDLKLIIESLDKEISLIIIPVFFIFTSSFTLIMKEVLESTIFPLKGWFFIATENDFLLSEITIGI